MAKYDGTYRLLLDERMVCHVGGVSRIVMHILRADVELGRDESLCRILEVETIALRQRVVDAVDAICLSKMAQHEASTCTRVRRNLELRGWSVGFNLQCGVATAH